MKYGKDVIYSLKVTGTMITNDNHYYLIENEGVKYKVKMLGFQQKLPVPDEVKCVVCGYDADDTPLFVQDKGEIARKLYTVGNDYTFVVHKKANYLSEQRNAFYGYDMNGIRAFIQVGMGKDLTIGRNVRCVVRHIDPDGSLLVVPVSQGMDYETNYLTIQQLLHNIHIETLPVCIQLETLRSESSENTKIQQLLKQYDNHEGEWLLSFLNILVAKREEKIEKKDWDGVCELISYQRLITEWVLEDSLFLTFYSSSVVQSLREKGEREMHVCEAILKAIDLIRTHTVDDFLQHIFAKIRTSGYLSDRNRKVDLLVALFWLDDTLADKNMAALTEFCQYVACTFTAETLVLDSVSGLIRKMIEKCKAVYDFSSTKKILHLLAVYLLLCHNRDVKATLAYRIMLYRYASLVSPASAGILMNRAYGILTQANQFYHLEFVWDDVLSFKPELFIAKLRAFMIDITGDGDKMTARYIANGNQILLHDGVFMLYAGCSPVAVTGQQKVTEMLSVFDGKVRIYADKDMKPKSNDLQNVVTLKDFWSALYGQSSQQVTSSAKKELIKTLPPEGMRVKIRLKAFNPRYPLMMFADVIEPGYEGTGALLANEVAYFHINSMEDLFYEGDTFEATVLRIGENNRITFSIVRELFEFVAGTVKFGHRVYAKLIRISKGTCIWICEDGYSLFSPGVIPYPDTDTVALLEIRDINDAGYVNAVYIEEADRSIEKTEALAKLVGEYIDFCSPQDEKMEEEDNFGQAFTDEEGMSGGEQLSQPLIHELAWLLTVEAFSKESLVMRYNLLAAARLLTEIIDDPVLGGYLSLQMNYEENIYSFATYTDQVRWSDFSCIDDEAVARYPSLLPKKELLRILGMFYSHTFDPVLAVNIATTKDPNKEHIIRLVLAHALLFQTLPATALIPLRNELLQRIGAGEFVEADEHDKYSAVEEQKEEIPCLGRESDTVEFKSSVVYPAGRTLPDMKQQSEVILRTIAGFLNASGGTLYIGVSDTGAVIGLKEDYIYMVCDSDAYERFIRQRVIATMGKDINGLIKIEFPQYGTREICRITIPCYGKLVELKGVIWQRQGNSTIMLDGNALAKQQKRKNKKLQVELGRIAEENQELVSESLLQTSEVQTAVAAAFVESLKKKKESKTAKVKKNAIQTSSIRLHSYLEKEDLDARVLTYLSLLDNGGYVLENEFSDMENAIVTLTIHADEIGGSLLLCYENACVNRIPLKILLQKKRNYIYKNGVSKDSKLIFVTVENGEPSILVRTVRKNNEYLKMYPIAKIKENMDLALKGTSLFSYDFGKVVAWEVIPEVESEKLQRLYNDNLAHQGCLSTAEVISEERELLRAMGWEIG